MVSGYEWVLVILVVLLIFGATRLPLLGRNLGQGIKEFKKGVSEAGRDDREGKDEAGKPATDERERGSTP